MILSCSLHNYRIKLSWNFATAIYRFRVTAQDSYATDSGFKAQWTHFFETKCSLNLSHKSYQITAVSGISSEWLRISDKPGKIA